MGTYKGLGFQDWGYMGIYYTQRKWRTVKKNTESEMDIVVYKA